MKRLIIAFITWMLVGVTVTAAWAAGPAKPVIEAKCRIAIAISAAVESLCIPMPVRPTAVR